MEISIKLNIVPFVAPRGVKVQQKPGEKQTGFTNDQLIELSELSPEVLSQLCDEFRKQVFDTAGKLDPKMQPML